MKLVVNPARILMLLALIPFVLIGCSGAEEHKAKYLERGKQYFNSENYDKARIELKNVLQIDPNTAEAYYYLARMDEAQGRVGTAITRYERAVTLDPDLLGARARVGGFYLLQSSADRLGGNSDGEQQALSRVRREVREILSRQPDHPDGLTLSASLMAREGDFAGAVAQLEQIIERHSGHSGAVMVLANLYEQHDMPDRVVPLLEQSLSTSDDGRSLRLHLAQYYLRNQEFHKAAQMMSELIAAHPTVLSYRSTLAYCYVNLGKTDDAEEVLRNSIRVDPDDPQRYLILAEFLVERKGDESAIAELNEVVNQRPELTELHFALAKLYADRGERARLDSIYENIIVDHGAQPAGLRARNELAGILLADGKFESAQTLVAEVLMENPRDNQALLLKAQIALATENTDEAIVALRSVLKDQPDSLDVLTMLADAHLRQGEHELAGANLYQAVEIAPENTQARLRLAKFYLVRKDFDDALEQINTVLQKDAKHRQALMLKGDLLTVMGNTKELGVVLENMKKMDPARSDVLLRNARLQLAVKNYDVALAEVERVLDRDPVNIRALVVKSDVFAARGDAERLAVVIGQIKEAEPENAEGYFRMARLYKSQGDLPLARQELELAFERAPESVSLMAELIDIRLTLGEASQVEADLQNLLAKQPGHPAAHKFLGSVYLSQNKLSAAEKEFLQQLEVNPDDSSSYLQVGRIRGRWGDLGGAAESFESGLVIEPDSRDLMLALASIRGQQRRFDDAIALCEDILRKYPDDELVAARLAEYRKRGRP